MMDTAMIRLSSGKRINSAKDDAAGIQVAIEWKQKLMGYHPLYATLMTRRLQLIQLKVL